MSNRSDVSFIVKDDFIFNASHPHVRQAGAGMVREKNTVGLTGASGWSGVREKYCLAGAGCQTQCRLSTNELAVHVVFFPYKSQ